MTLDKVAYFGKGKVKTLFQEYGSLQQSWLSILEALNLQFPLTSTVRRHSGQVIMFPVWSSLTIHSRQYECKQGKILGFLNYSKQIAQVKCPSTLARSNSILLSN